jgi:hypothetical protein
VGTLYEAVLSSIDRSSKLLGLGPPHDPHEVPGQPGQPPCDFICQSIPSKMLMTEGFPFFHSEMPVEQEDSLIRPSSEITRSWHVVAKVGGKLSKYVTEARRKRLIMRVNAESQPICCSFGVVGVLSDNDDFCSVKGC